MGMLYFLTQRTHATGRRELANQHDVLHGKAGSTESLSDFAPKSDSTSSATQAVALALSESTAQIHVPQATSLPQPPRSILHNPTCSGYFIETVGTAVLCRSRSY